MTPAACLTWFERSSPVLSYLPASVLFARTEPQLRPPRAEEFDSLLVAATIMVAEVKYGGLWQYSKEHGDISPIVAAHRRRLGQVRELGFFGEIFRSV